MKLLLKRRFLGGTYTIGTLIVDGVRFCDTLEDTVRTGPKIPGKTAIPAGTYNVILNVSPKFGRELPRLQNVSGFDGILIHRGNTAADTSGCILVGENRVKGQVVNSTLHEIELVKRCKAAIARGEKITITVE